MTGRGRAFLLAVMILGGAGVAWQITTRAVAHRFAQSDPSIALSWSSADPEALTRLSDQHLAGQGAAKNLAAAETLARRAIVVAPLQAEALRNLGLIADARRDHARAQAILIRAGYRGYRDVGTDAWLLQHALAGGALQEAFLRFDAILRTEPELADRLFPALAAVAGIPLTVGPLSKRLQSNPPWRTAALTYLGEHASDIRPIIALYNQLAAAGSPPTETEQGALLSRMIKDGQFADARHLWVSLIPAAPKPSELVYDGRFRGLVGPPPFNWSLVEPPGVAVQSAKADGRRSTGLFVQYPVRDRARFAEQLLVLPPGTYRFTVRYRIATAAAGADLGWILRCASEGPPLMESRQKGDAVTAWAAVGASFTVPADCPAQWLRLDGRAGDGFGDLSAFYDDVAVTPGESGEGVMMPRCWRGIRRPRRQPCA